MHHEIIRANPKWQKTQYRYDTVLVQNNATAADDGMHGIIIGQVLQFLSFIHNNVRYPCTLVKWFLPVGDEVDPLTGMWIVKPEMVGNEWTVGLVHLDCIVRACHLISVYGETEIPTDFKFHHSLDAFALYYINKFGDYNAHECIT
ncbi:hypothetical protein JAAARDRAFT_134067 [Jaapia argillacea MUCL 33604]|uniref:Uncharacterized protein n=1 Tax=Jaapia argillacea MUCL 33604 TaxID=933084 RepID=A0A067PYD7_9AGAM|nr:hypothetical protein JAAARDRAFT_134067 [Jaapia argillacea MUCL 33604]